MGKESGDPECLKDKEDVDIPDVGLIPGFRVGAVEDYPLKVRLTDMDDNVYTIPMKEKFAEYLKNANYPTNRSGIVDIVGCSVMAREKQVHSRSR